MKILIIDDERLTREGLRSSIIRLFPDIEVLPMADNGVDGLRIANMTDPDILFVDVRMPGMDGLQLIESLCEKAIDTEFVVVSGYDSFEYAVKAMKMGVKHYILKPCKDKEIQAVINQSIADILQRRSIRKYMESMYTVRSKTLTVPAAVPSKNKIVQQAIQYIDGHLDSSDLTINSLARNVLFVRPDYFGKLFKRETGMKPSEYIRTIRIERAKTLLHNPDYRIHEICLMCGFGNNIQYFCFLFKLFEGCTPSQYRLWEDEIF